MSKSKVRRLATVRTLWLLPATFYAGMKKRLTRRQSQRPQAAVAHLERSAKDENLAAHCPWPRVLDWMRRVALSICSRECGRHRFHLHYPCRWDRSSQWTSHGEGHYHADGARKQRGVSRRRGFRD